MKSAAIESIVHGSTRAVVERAVALSKEHDSKWENSHDKLLDHDKKRSDDKEKAAFCRGTFR